MRALLRTADGAIRIAELPDSQPAIWKVDIQLTVDPQQLLLDPELVTNRTRIYEKIGSMNVYQETNTI